MIKSKKNNRSHILVATLVLIALIAIGVLSYRLTHAASAVVSIQPETATISSPASKQTDTTASAGAAVRFSTPSPSVCAPKKFVVVGSSTAFGTGASPISSSWVNLYTAYLQGRNPSNSLINLALGGYTTYQALPTGSAPVVGRPAPDTTRNITAAIANKPQAIIINMPTNDVANGYSLTEIEANFQTIKATTDKAAIPLWVTTSQPRDLSLTGRNNLIMLKNWILTTYGTKSLDFWTTVANTDGSINPTYSHGDGTHLNNAGHSILYNRVVTRDILGIICGI